MHPLIIWATTAVHILEPHDERLRHQHLEHAEELTALDRDGRWAAAIRRWADQDVAAAEYDRIDPIPSRAGSRRAGRRLSPSW